MRYPPKVSVGSGSRHQCRSHTFVAPQETSARARGSGWQAPVAGVGTEEGKHCVHTFLALHALFLAHRYSVYPILPCCISLYIYVPYFGVLNIMSTLSATINRLARFSSDPARVTGKEAPAEEALFPNPAPARAVLNREKKFLSRTKRLKN